MIVFYYFITLEHKKIFCYNFTTILFKQSEQVRQYFDDILIISFDGAKSKFHLKNLFYFLTAYYLTIVEKNIFKKEQKLKINKHNLNKQMKQLIEKCLYFSNWQLRYSYLCCFSFFKIHFL